MERKEIDEYLLNDGFNELDVQMKQLKRWVAEKRWSEAYVRIGDIIRLLQGIRKVVDRLGKE